MCNLVQRVPDDPTEPWFSANHIGKNSLRKVVKEVCLEGGIVGRKTNPSL